MLTAHYKRILKDPAVIERYVDEVLRNGYALLPDFFELGYLIELEQFAATNRSDAGMKGISLKSGDGTPMMRVARSEEFMDFFNAVYRARCAKEGKEYRPLDPLRQWVGLPFKDATGGAKTKQTEFHYDGAYVNATVGIIEPPEGQGELHMFPNFRMKFPHPLLSKVASRLLRHSKALRSLYGYVSVPSKRNTLCLFFGDRSFHGVEPITEGKRMILTINNHW
jgi:hypothetical protein